MSNPVIEVLCTIPFSEVQTQRLQESSSRARISVLPARRLDDIPLEVWARAEVLYTDRILPPPAQVPNLRWLQFHYAGIDFAVENPLVQKPGLQVTTLSGANAPEAAEHALMLMLALGHHIPEVIAYQNRAEWPRDRAERFSPRELRHTVVGIVGYGSIGRELARLLLPFGVVVLATKRDVMQPADLGYTIPETGDVEGDLFTRLYPIQALHSMIKDCDFVVVTLPLTAQTRGIFSTAELAAMKTTAFLVDVSRGGVVDQAALFQALQEKRIAGAGLDVFSEEPLPPTSPLWKLPNVMITPHIAGISPFYLDRATDLFAENLKRYTSGMSLLNLFEAERGY